MSAFWIKVGSNGLSRIRTFEVLSHYWLSAQNEWMWADSKDLLENLREGSLIDFHELLQLVEIVAKQPESFVKGHIA